VRENHDSENDAEKMLSSLDYVFKMKFPHEVKLEAAEIEPGGPKTRPLLNSARVFERLQVTWPDEHITKSIDIINIHTHLQQSWSACR